MVDESTPGSTPGSTPAPTPAASTPPVISLSIKDLKVLYVAYMPYVDGGGLFIPTKKVFKMGENLSLLLSLMNEEKKYSVNGKVVWITPDKAHNNMVPGVGVQFSGLNAISLAAKIEQLLSAMAISADRTNTM